MNNSDFQSILGLEHVSKAEQAFLLKHASLRAIPEHARLTVPHLHYPKVILVLTGRAEISYQDAEGHAVSLGFLEPGMIIGNDSLDTQSTMSAMLTAMQDMLVLQWSSTWIIEQHTQLTAWKSWLYEHSIQQRVLITLSRVPLFNTLSLEDRVTITRSLQSRMFERDVVVFEQGSAASSLFLVAEGQFIIERDQKLVATLGQGDFFGEMALVSQGQLPHNATVRSYTTSRCLELPGDVFQQLLETYQPMRQALTSEIDRRLANLERVQNNPREQEHLAVAVEHGVFRGSHVLIRLPALCPPDCRICEQACEERFGQSRIKLNGANIDIWDLTTSCRQCHISAECIAACPENAIQLESNGAYIINDNCTGCGDCVPACPYNAIDLQPITLEEKQGPLWELWRNISHPKQNPRFVANKCDYCAGHTDLACLSQCPTGSLRLLPIEEIFSF